MKTFNQFISEMKFDRREYASRGYIHPDDVGYHKLGRHVDFYEIGTGDKKYGKVTHNNGKTIHISHKVDGVGISDRFKVGHPGALKD